MILTLNLLTGKRRGYSLVAFLILTLLAALVQLQSLAFVKAGPGAVAFGAVVVLTMLAAIYFDPRLIWDPLRKERKI